MSITSIRERISGSRPLTVAERAIVAVTVTLAVATVALAVAGSAGASPAGQLPAGGPYAEEPFWAVSHAEMAPLGIDQSIGD